MVGVDILMYCVKLLQTLLARHSGLDLEPYKELGGFWLISHPSGNK